MKPWQARLIIEKTELHLKINDLKQFISSETNLNTLTSDEKFDLRYQLGVMEMYFKILQRRSARFMRD